MKLTSYQVSIISLVLKIDKEGKQRTFPLEELTTASDIFKKIKDCIPKEQGEVFTECEAKFTSEENVFITKLVNERNWAVEDADHLFDLKELLK